MLQTYTCADLLLAEMVKHDYISDRETCLAHDHATPIKPLLSANVKFEQHCRHTIIDICVRIFVSRTDAPA